MALKKAYDAEVSPYLERPQLTAAWDNITKHYQPHEITAGKIHATVDPDWADKQPSKIDRHLVGRAAQQAARRGMTLNEYIEDLVAQDEYDQYLETAPTAEPHS